MPVHYTVTFDAVDHRSLSAWWAETLDCEVNFANDEIAIVRPAGGHDPSGAADEHILFLRVPEGKAAKNRCHLDLHPDGDTEAYLQELLDRGATRVDGHGAPWPVRWAVLQDPEGNEFCVILGPVDA